MGSSGSKTYSLNRTNQESRNHTSSQFSLINFVENLSGRSFRSAATQRSAFSVSGQWSRKSRHRYQERTFNKLLESSKTSWPVPLMESSFLPEFKILTDVKQSNFKVLNLISKGAYGVVYKVEMLKTGQLFAMKILNKSKVVQENYVSQVKEEVKIQTMCGHNPFIVNCLFHWQNKRQLFIVTEYLNGGDLYSLCGKYGPLPEDLSRIYIAEMALALDFLHNAGVIFRDLKLENVLLDSVGHALLIDFGLAKWLKYGERTKTMCGTLQYMAPEVFSLNSYGHAVDWWSLGVLACYLLTSMFPGGGNSSTPGVLPSGCDSLNLGGRDLLRRLLEPDQSRRLRSLMRLQEIPFFHGFSFADVRSKKVKPQDLLANLLPRNSVQMKEDDVIFYDFDAMSPTLV